MPEQAISRRRALAAGLTLTLPGCLGDSPLPDREPDPADLEDSTPPGMNESEAENLDPFPENGVVVFVYDDSPIEDFTKAFPVHREFDAPATTCVVSEWIGRTHGPSEWLDLTHLEELDRAGWEIASHTTEHLALASFELVEPAAPDDARIYPESIEHGFHEDKEIEIIDAAGDQTVRRSVRGIGEDSTGRYLELADELGTAFAAGAHERYPAELMHETLRDAKATLEDRGFEVRTLLAPYDEYDEYSRQFAPEYYDGVANANHMPFVNSSRFDPLEASRGYFIEHTRPETVRSALDEIRDRPGIGVFGAHSVKDEVTQSRIRQTLEWAEARGIEVVTFAEAIELSNTTR